MTRRLGRAVTEDMMMKLSSLLVVSLLLSFTGSVEAQGSIGFVDVQRVILEYRKTASITEQLEKELRARYEVLRQERGRIRALKDNLDLVEEGSLEQLQRLREIRLMEVDLELKEKNAKILLEQRLVEHMKKVYAEVLKEVEILAGERGMTAIFMVNNNPIEGRTRDDVGSNILIRPILWHHPNRDLTSELIQRLNR